MARPRKCRRICQMPRTTRFAPEDGGAGEICMSLDEFESIRLIDLEGLTQEECAARMNVARTTVQAVYASARAKVAECLVNEKELVIAGGEYVLCDGGAAGCGCAGRCGRRCAHGGAVGAPAPETGPK